MIIFLKYIFYYHRYIEHFLIVLLSYIESDQLWIVYLLFILKKKLRWLIRTLSLTRLSIIFLFLLFVYIMNILLGIDVYAQVLFCNHHEYTAFYMSNKKTEKKKDLLETENDSCNNHNKTWIVIWCVNKSSTQHSVERAV